MSSGVISSNRSTENFSTANEPIAEPYTTARRRFASERSPRLREISHESAGERIAGAGRIEHRLERIRRREEDRRLGEHERAVLALLDHDVLRAALHDPARRLHEVELLGELARLGVVERDQIDALEQLEQIGTPALDPEVHRVARDELRLVDLRQHVELEPRIDVAEEHERRRCGTARESSAGSSRRRRGASRASRRR